jgi:hypothetical protein
VPPARREAEMAGRRSPEMAGRPGSIGVGVTRTTSRAAAAPGEQEMGLAPSTVGASGGCTRDSAAPGGGEREAGSSRTWLKEGVIFFPFLHHKTRCKCELVAVVSKLPLYRWPLPPIARSIKSTHTSFLVLCQQIITTPRKNRCLLIG